NPAAGPPDRRRRSVVVLLVLVHHLAEVGEQLLVELQREVADGHARGVATEVRRNALLGHGQHAGQQVVEHGPGAREVLVFRLVVVVLLVLVLRLTSGRGVRLGTLCGRARAPLAGVAAPAAASAGVKSAERLAGG